MKNFISFRIYLLIGLVISLSLLWPLFAAPYFTHHDDVQIIRLYEMDRCFKDGQIPCRWVPDLGGLYGYPLFNYYAPLPYYFGELIFLLTHNLIFSAKVMFAISFLGSFVFMYLFARKFWGELGGSLAAVFYSFAPYHAVDFYVRGAMGEMWALMIFPGLLWAVGNLAEKINIKNILFWAIFWAMLIISHNLSAMIFLPIIILWMLFLFYKNKKTRLLWAGFAALILGVFLSSFYLFPMLFEKNLAHVETTTYGYFSYTEHFKGLRRLFLDRSWGWGASVREVPGGEKDGMSFQIGWIHLLGWILALYAAYKFRSKKRYLALSIMISSGVILVSVFMINPRSEFIWKIIEPLKYLQFPWRFLMIIILFGSFISGSFIAATQKKIWWWSILVAMVVVFNFLYFRPEKFLQITDNDLLKGENWDRQIKRSIFDYLPIYAKEPPAELAKDKYQILTGDIRIIDFNNGTNWFKFKTETMSHSIIRLSQYYFPNWRIMVDGKEVPIEYKDNTLGLMTIILGKGNHQIEGRLYDTPIRTIANFMTIFGFGLTALLFLIQFKNVRKWILYYRKGIN